MMNDSGIGLRASGVLAGEARERASRLGVAVVHGLVTAIVTGEIPEGSMLPIESELATHFGVSRTVIRESVKRVEEKGFLRIVQGSGTTVRSRSSWNVLDPVVLQVMLENDASLGVLDDLAIVRSALEGAMAAETARGRSRDELARLEEAYELMAATISDVEDFADADGQFHAVVMSASHVSLAENITRSLYERARESSRFTLNATREAFDATMREHFEVLDAIRTGDGERAERAMRHHIMEAWQRRRPPTQLRP